MPRCVGGAGGWHTEQGEREIKLSAEIVRLFSVAQYLRYGFPLDKRGNVVMNRLRIDESSEPMISHEANMSHNAIPFARSIRVFSAMDSGSG